MRGLLFAYALLGVLGLTLIAQEAPTPVPPKPPVVDALDKAILANAQEAQAIAQKACDASDTSKHFQAAQKLANLLIEANHPGFRWEWSKGVLVAKEPAK